MILFIIMVCLVLLTLPFWLVLARIVLIVAAYLVMAGGLLYAVHMLSVFLGS